MANRFVQCAGCGGNFAFHHPGDKNWKPNFRQHGFIEINGLYFSSPKCLKKWEAMQKMKIQAPEQIYDVLAERLKEWLGSRGVRYFQLLKSRFGTVSPVIKLNFKRKHIPVHPVHLREGMQIRNFLREQPECAEWTAHDFDDRWKRITELAIQREK